MKLLGGSYTGGYIAHISDEEYRLLSWIANPVSPKSNSIEFDMVDRLKKLISVIEHLEKIKNS